MKKIELFYLRQKNNLLGWQITLKNNEKSFFPIIEIMGALCQKNTYNCSYLFIFA